MRADPAPVDPVRVDRAIAATWPARAEYRAGPWVLRDGDAGGRSRAAYLAGDYAAGCVDGLLAACAARGLRPLVRVRGWEDALDADLVARGWPAAEEVVALTAAADALANPTREVVLGWPPVARMVEMWAAGGIGPMRLATMARFAGPKVAALGRDDQRAGAVAYVNLWDGIAVLHALHTVPALRRRGLARAILGAAAHWGVEQGAEAVMVVVSADNAPARALYASSGFALAGRYRYRSPDGVK